MRDFHEMSWYRECQVRNLDQFYQYVQHYDDSLAPILKAQGYVLKGKSERTVVFTFGEATFRRNRWYKKGRCRIPVDELLGLKKYERYSFELLYRIASLATYLSYRQVAEVIETCFRVSITKDTVLKARKLATRFLEEQEDYRFFEEDVPVEKIKTDVIYIEGDGVMVKSREPQYARHRMDLSHFLIHTGTRQVGKNRFELMNKKEIISHNNYQARQAVLDYLYNHYEISDDTVLITNSDGGQGYTPYIFKEIAKALKIKKHEHFWDKYHVYQDIKLLTRPYGGELKNILFEAIRRHDKGLLRTGFDTLEALAMNDEELDKVIAYRKKFMKNFQFTKLAEQRQLRSSGIGVMESQHRKITYRMKHRGAYWSEDGAVTMAKLLLTSKEERRDLFFGDWRQRYRKYKDDEVERYRPKPKHSQQQRDDYLPKGRLRGIKLRF